MKSKIAFSTWLEGAAKAMRAGVGPELLVKILGNNNLFSAGYKRADLLKDLGQLANVKGFSLLADTLSFGNKTVLKVNKGAIGFRWELEATAELSRRGYEVVELTRKEYTTVGKNAGKLETDIDALVKIDGKLFYMQMKASSAAVGGAGTAVKGALGTKAQVQTWANKALGDLRKIDPNATLSQIVYVVPKGTKIPKGIKEWFDDVNVNISLIDDIVLK